MKKNKLKSKLDNANAREEYTDIKCVFCKHHFTNKPTKLSEIRDHYEQEHDVKKDSNLLRLYLKSFTKKSAKKALSCPVCGDIQFTDHYLYTHVFGKHYNFTEVDFSNFKMKTTVNVSDSLPDNVLYTYGLYEETHDTEYNFKDEKLMTVITKLAVSKHLQTYLQNAGNFGNNTFLANLTMRLTNKKVNTQETVNTPYIGQTDLVSTRVLNDQFTSALTDSGMSYIFKGDNRGSGYQFYQFHSLIVRIRNNKVNFINHFFGGKRKNPFIDEEAEVASGNDDDEVIDSENEDDRLFIDDSKISSDKNTSSSSSSSEDETMILLKKFLHRLENRRKKKKRKKKHKVKKRRLNITGKRK